LKAALTKNESAQKDIQAGIAKTQSTIENGKLSRFFLDILQAELLHAAQQRIEPALTTKVSPQIAMMPLIEDKS